MLRPWLETLASSSASSSLDPDDLGVFSRPLRRWKEFQMWQHNNRNDDTTNDKNFSAFAEEKRRYFKSTGLGSLTTEPYFDDTLQSLWREEQARRRWEQKNNREVRGGSFGDYIKAARRRLGDHSFSEAFQFLEDPRKQEERATWIEYLDFEYWWLDQRPKSKPKSVRAEADKPRQLLLVQWALDQLPEKSPETTSARKGRKRRRPDDDDETTVDKSIEKPTTKRQKQKQSQSQKQERTRRRATLNDSGLGPVNSDAWTRNQQGQRRSTRIAALG